jgi:hypothetical protein
MAAVLSLASLMILPPFVDLLPTPGIQVMGAIAGLIAGCLARAKQRRAS